MIWLYMHYGFIFKGVGGGGWGEGERKGKGRWQSFNKVTIYMHHDCMTFIWKCEHWTQTDLPEVISSP